jgi:multiple sugar transport system substrate-binding protein
MPTNLPSPNRPNLRKLAFSGLLILFVFMTILFSIYRPVPWLGALAQAKPSKTDSSPSTQPVSSGNSNQPVELTWLVRKNAPEQEWESETLIPAFEAQNPAIKIRLVSASWADYDSRFQALVSGGTPPDVFSHWGFSGFQDYLQQGQVADLTPWIQKDRFDTTDYWETALNAYTVDQKIMGLPVMTTGSYVFYNRDMFDAAGEPYPPTNWADPQWTTDAFLQKCKRLAHSSPDPKNQFTACGLALWPNDAYPWLYGQNLYSDQGYQSGFPTESHLDQQNGIKGFQLLETVRSLNGTLDSASYLDYSDQFRQQKTAMVMMGGWGWKNFSGVKNIHWAAAALPWGSANRRDVLFTDPWLISAQSQHPQEAWTFVKFLASREVQKAWMEVTGDPPARKSLVAEWSAQFPAMTVAQVKEVLAGSFQYGQETPSHQLVQFDRLDKIVSAAIDPLENHGEPVLKTLPAAQPTLNAALRQIQAEMKK